MVHQTHSTKPLKEKEIERAWHLIDAKDQVVGRVATQIAEFLMGKHKVNYASYLDAGDNVVVINAAQMKLTGNKEVTKLYSRYSGYPGGLKKIGYKEMKEKHLSEVVRHAVSGMLPKNKQRSDRLTRLFVYPDADHPYGVKVASNS